MLCQGETSYYYYKKLCRSSQQTLSVFCKCYVKHIWNRSIFTNNPSVGSSTIEHTRNVPVDRDCFILLEQFQIHFLPILDWCSYQNLQEFWCSWHKNTKWHWVLMVGCIRWSGFLCASKSSLKDFAQNDCFFESQGFSLSLSRILHSYGEVTISSEVL